MKKMRTVLFIAAAAILFVLISCQDPFLSEPHFPSDGGATGRGIRPPEGVRASQGEKRSITLTWNEDPKAALYYIYNAESPLNTFVRCGETSSTLFTFNVPPGSTLYYRVSSVLPDGTESAQSVYVRGTSLAQPIISDITDITESSSSVTWYMENVFDDSYKNELLYTVYCYNGSVEIARIALDGSELKENRAEFTGLAPNTNYEYLVEAYLRTDQHTTEKSIKMNKATARRFRPGAPRDVRATRGTAKDKITISFELPDMVDIALGDNLYDPKPLYFKIFKRVYTENGINEPQMALAYFGSMTGKGGQTFPGGAGYIPGAIVTWSDTKVDRGIRYEYMVQSFVDDTPTQITNDASISSADGWALGEGTLSFGKVEYTLGTEKDLYVEASLPLNFEFDPQNISYGYNLIEEIEPLDDQDENNPDEEITREIHFDSYNAVHSHKPKMNLEQKTTQDNPGRGLYSYAVEILFNGTVLDTISALGKVEVSENTQPIIVENFRVTDGYTDKFVLKWDYDSSRKYYLYTVDSKGNNPQDIDSVPAGLNVGKNYSYSYTEGVTTGETRYFAIRPARDIGGGEDKKGQMVYAATASQTLGVPEASLGGNSTYSAVTVRWTKAQKADTYRVKFRYKGEAGWREMRKVKEKDLTVDALGDYKYTFKPEGNEIDVTKAGQEIEIQVDALNEGLWEKVGGAEISTSSTDDVKTHLVGPAKLNLSVSQATSASDITVSWDKISGAGGYYVFRRQFNMNNTAEEGAEAVVYYVPAAGTSVIGKNLALDQNNSKIDGTVKATVGITDSRYTLKDIYMPDNQYGGSEYIKNTAVYRNQQNDMAQGWSYRYYVVPVISDSHTNELASMFTYNTDSATKNTDIKDYTIQDGKDDIIKYLGAASSEREGFIIGFGQNVTATKGTYVSGTYNATTNNVNNGVKITWDKPLRLPDSGFTYNVYSRESGGSDWKTVTTNVVAREYSAPPEKRGVAYEYVIGISGSGGSSDPRYNQRFIDKCYKDPNLDEKGIPKMLGFMLDSVKMDSVSRNEQKVGDKFAEKVNWKSAGIKYRDGVGNKWGIDGYEVYVMNRNIDAEWHKITELTNIPDQTDQSVMVTTGMGSVTLNTTAGAMSFDLLRVMRDYKHFFKIRSYVKVGDNKVYCPDPNWTYLYQFGTSEADHIAKSNNMQNEYVKWGARQITSDEFIKIVSVYASRGINESWSGSTKTYNAGTSWGGSGSVTQNYTYKLATDAERNYNYSNFKVDLQTRTGQWMTFLTLNGKIWSRMYPIGSWAFRYGEDGWVTVKGPWDTPDLYTGQIKFGINGLGDNSGFSWNGNGTLSGGTNTGSSGGTKAKVGVKYPGTVANPGAAAEQQILYRGQDTALQFKGESDNRYQLEEYK